MSIYVTELRPGTTVEIDKEPLVVLDYSHIKMGRGGAIVRAKFRNLKSQSVFERTFKASERVEPAHIERLDMQFLYSSKDEYYFMDQESFEQITLTKNQLEDKANYLKEGFIASVITYEGSVLGVDLPLSMELKISETGPGFKGDTVSGGSKPAVLETGITIQVPIFINTGDTVKVDTRSGKYLERV